MRRLTQSVIAVAAVSLSLMVGTRQVEASVIAVPAFSGTLVESWESFTNDTLPPGPAVIMNGAATISNTLPLMYVYDTTGTNFGLQLGLASGVAGTHDGTQGMGIDDYPDTTTTEIIFDSPVTAFGAYWAASGGSGSLATVTLSFYDANDDQLGSDVTFDYLFSSGGALVWHGWAADPGETIKRVTYEGSGIAFDSLQATQLAAPEPATLAMFVMGLSVMAGYALMKRRSSQNSLGN